MKKINLSEIFDLNANDFCEFRDLNDTAVMSKEIFTETVKSICKQVINLAAENVSDCYEGQETRIILDTINQIE